MRSDITQTFEDFERIAEDYFMMIPPDTDSFNLEICTRWEFDDAFNTLTFYFDDPWKFDEFHDKLLECPRYEESFAVGDHFEGADRQNLKIVVEGKESGLL